MKRYLLLMLALVMLAFGYYYVKRADAEGQVQINNLSVEVEPLQQEKDRLQKERENLNEEFSILLRDPSTVQFLFRELNKNIYTDVYPIMRDRGITGVLGISTMQYPGLMGCLSKSQYDRLLMDGWGTCLVFDLNYRYNFENWFSYMTQAFQRDGYELPKAILFSDNSYDPDVMDNRLIQAGINTVIVNAEDGHSETVSEVKKLWYTGAMPWNYTGLENDIQRLSLTDGANLVFTLTMNDMWDAFDAKSFEALLDALDPILVHESIFDKDDGIGVATTGRRSDPNDIEPMLKVLNIQDAREAHRIAGESRDSLLREHVERDEELAAQIAALDEQINDVYQNWNNK